MVAQKLQKFQLSVEKHRFEQEECLFLPCPGMWNFIGIYAFQAFPFKHNFSPKYDMKDSQKKSKRLGKQPSFIDGSLINLDWINNGLVELKKQCTAQEMFSPTVSTLISNLELLLRCSLCLGPMESYLDWCEFQAVSLTYTECFSFFMILLSFHGHDEMIQRWSGGRIGIFLYEWHFVESGFCLIWE